MGMFEWHFSLIFLNTAMCSPLAFRLRDNAGVSLNRVIGAQNNHLNLSKMCNYSQLAGTDEMPFSFPFSAERIIYIEFGYG